jgi:hypothetical protein
MSIDMYNEDNVMAAKLAEALTIHDTEVHRAHAQGREAGLAEAAAEVAEAAAEVAAAQQTADAAQQTQQATTRELEEYKAGDTSRCAQHHQQRLVSENAAAQGRVRQAKARAVQWARQIGKSQRVLCIGQDGQVVGQGCKQSARVMWTLWQAGLLTTQDETALRAGHELTFALSEHMAPVLISYLMELGIGRVEATVMLLDEECVKSLDIFRLVRAQKMYIARGFVLPALRAYCSCLCAAERSPREGQGQRPQAAPPGLGGVHEEREGKWPRGLGDDCFRLRRGQPAFPRG